MCLHQASVVSGLVLVTTSVEIVEDAFCLAGMRGGTLICWRPRVIVAVRGGQSALTILLMLRPVRVCASHEAARAVNTMVRWASMLSRSR